MKNFIFYNKKRIIKNKYAEADKQYLKDNYGKISSKIIAENLNRKLQSIYCKASDMDLTKKNYSQNNIRFLKNNCRNKSAKELSEVLSKTPRSIFAKCHREGIILRKLGENSCRSKLTNIDVELIFCLKDEEVKISEIADKFDVSDTTIRRVLNYQSHTYAF